MESRFNKVVAVGCLEVVTSSTPGVVVRRTDAKTHGPPFNFVSKHGEWFGVPLLAISDDLQEGSRH